jgi:hypothetical protein
MSLVSFSITSNEAPAIPGPKFVCIHLDAPYIDKTFL